MNSNNLQTTENRSLQVLMAKRNLRSRIKLKSIASYTGENQDQIVRPGTSPRDHRENQVQRETLDAGPQSIKRWLNSHKRQRILPPILIRSQACRSRQNMIDNEDVIVADKISPFYQQQYHTENTPFRQTSNQSYQTIGSPPCVLNAQKSQAIFRDVNINQIENQCDKIFDCMRALQSDDNFYNMQLGGQRNMFHRLKKSHSTARLTEEKDQQRQYIR